jgi:hypothetical protein
MTEPNSALPEGRMSMGDPHPDPLLRAERVALHLFSSETAAGGPDAHHVSLHEFDTVVPVGCTRKYKGLISMSHDTRSILNAILRPFGPKFKIHIMRIVSHGDAGQLFFNGMTRAETISEEWRRLRSYFAPTASLELHGCGVASQTSIVKDFAPANSPPQAYIKDGTFNGAENGLGLKFMRALSSKLGVQVTAGIDVQWSSANDWTYERDTVTVFPNGKFRYDNPEGRGMSKSEIESKARSELVSIQLELFPPKLYVAAKERLQSLINHYPGTPSAKEAKVYLSWMANLGDGGVKLK